MKSTKRILSCALSLIMAFSCFSVVPFVTTAETTDNLTVIEPTLAEGKTNTESGYTWTTKAEKLYAGSSLKGTTLQVDNIYDSTLAALGDNNLITSVVAKDSSSGTYTFNLTKVTDGDIYDRTNKDTADYSPNFTFPARTSVPLGSARFGTDTYDAELTVTLNSITEIDTLYAFAHPGIDLAWNTYKIYVGNNLDTLYSDANEVAYFDYYEAYKNTATVAWSLNGTHSGDGTSRRSEGQIWKFTGEKKPVGKYVGYKIYFAEGTNNRIDLYDIGVFGDKMLTVIEPTLTEGKTTTESGYTWADKAKKLDVGSNFAGTTLQVDNIYNSTLAALGDNNLITSVVAEDPKGGTFTFDLTAVTDGKIFDAGNNPNSYYTAFTFPDRTSGPLGSARFGTDTYDAELTVTLNGITEIDTLYAFAHPGVHLAWSTYKIYVGNDSDTLYSDANEVAHFDYYEAYSTEEASWSLNGVHQDPAANRRSEGQIWKFTGEEKPVGKYVGYKIYFAEKTANRLDLYDIGVFGKNLNKATADTTAAEITSNYTASVQATNITPDFLTTDRINNNIMKNGTISVTDNAGNTVSSSGSVAAITDGVMDTAGSYTANSFWYVYNSLTDGASPQGYVTLGLDSVYSLDELYLLGSPRANYALLDYEIYAGTDEATLYNDANLVATFKYSGYTSDSTTAGKLNTANNNQNSEGQIYTFTGEDKPLAKYIGIKVFDGAIAQAGWVYFSEIGILGNDTMISLDTSALNDETSIEPVTTAMVEGQPCSFKVNVKNGGTATKVTVGGEELTAVDGVYTIPFLVKNAKITVETDRDEYATKDGKWCGLNLNLGSASYGKNIWDGDYVVHETAMFYTGHTAVQLLYPIDNIVTIRSYDFKETYWIGEDFEIVDGKLVLTENSRITPYENPEDLKNQKADGNTDYTSIGNWESKQWKYQVRVTYTYSDTWDGTTYNVAPEGKLGDLAKFHKKALSGEDTTVLFLGDSISVGCNASGLYQETLSYNGGADASTLSTKIQSYYARYGLSAVPEWGNNSWAYQVVEGLKDKYDNDNIKMVNKAVGSSASTWGSKTENLDFFLDGVNPDLVFIGYGMNENDTESINDNLKTIIDYVREINPNCSVVLVSAFVPNFANGTDNNLDTQEADYYELLEEYDNIAIAPVNSVFHSLQTVKVPADYTANCYNHPNDFGVSLYASTVLATLSGEVTPIKVSFTDNSNNVVHTVEDYGEVTITEEDWEAAESVLPLVFGYEFSAWDKVDVTTTTEDVTIKAIYKKSTTDKYSVKAIDGDDIYEGMHLFDARLTATATGEGFSYWKDNANGSAISANQAYTFYVPGDISIEAVYNDDTEDAVKAVVLNSSVQKAQRADGKYNLYFTGEIKLPENAELTAIGITYTNSEDNIENLETTLSQPTSGIGSNTYNGSLKEGSIMVILSGVNANKQRWAKLYVTYTLNGETTTVYSDCTAACSTAAE